MNKKITFCTLLLAGILFSSCEKVIDVNINDSEKKYVIEAEITDKVGTARVLLTETKNFDEDNNFAGISGALITVTETGGATYSFNETSAGVYQAASLKGTSGKQYTLSVSVNGQTFTSTAQLPTLITLDSIFVTDELLFSDTRKIVNAVYQDPSGRGNNYRFIQFINGKKVSQIIVNNDDYTDGRYVVNKLFYFPDDDEDSMKIKSGDNVKVQMLGIDANVYRYWFSLDRSSTGGSNQATPSNPVTNIKGGALGYFSAHTIQERSIIVP